MKNEKGFTLIELLVVIAIIGILAAIAIPQFAEYKTRAFNSRAQTDLRNGLTAEEAYFVDFEVYHDCADAVCQADLPGFALSDNVSIEFTTAGAAPAGAEYAGAACSARGDKDFTWSSRTNVMQNADNGGACAPAPAL